MEEEENDVKLIAVRCDFSLSSRLSHLGRCISHAMRESRLLYLLLLPILLYCGKRKRSPSHDPQNARPPPASRTPHVEASAVVSATGKRKSLSLASCFCRRLITDCNYYTNNSPTYSRPTATTVFVWLFIHSIVTGCKRTSNHRIEMGTTTNRSFTTNCNSICQMSS